MDMRCIWLSITILYSMIIPLNAQWETMNSGIRGRLNSLDFINSRTGWLAGTMGTILMTEDGGLTWDEVFIEQEWHFQGIDFIDQVTGWATGWDSNYEYNLILKTVDGGESWTVQQKVKNVYFFAPQVLGDSVVIVGSSTMILKSVTGGSEWTDISPSGTNLYLSSVYFLDRNKGIATGSVEENSTWRGIIFKTYDGGKTWKKSTIPEFSGFSSLQMINDSEGYFLATGDTGGLFLYHTKDTCNTWSVIKTGDYFIENYFLLHNGNLYAAVYDTLYDQYLLKSGDGGETWENIIALHNWRVSNMYLNDLDQGILLYQMLGWEGWGESSTQLIMTNLFEPGQWMTRKFSYTFEDVYFRDIDDGLVFGGYFIFHGPTGGDIFTTTDGGITWSLDHSFPAYVYASSFPAYSVGYILLRDWRTYIYKTTDGGSIWTLAYYFNPDSTGFEITINDIAFSSEEVGYGVGRFWSQDSAGACIVETSDGGRHWEFLWTLRDEGEIYYELSALHLVNKTIWAVGLKGLIVTISVPDSFRIIQPKTDLPLNDVYFSDAQHGWIAGGYWSDQDARPILLKTSDGGFTWKVDAELPYLVKEIFFRDSRQGWVVGSDSTGQGMVLATDNGGEFWSVQAEHLPGSLNGFHFIGDYGWAVGEQGLVLKTDNGGASWIDVRKPAANPQTFQLYQNYPNPFNRSTVISWQSAVGSEVALTVYNLLGEKMAKLVLGYMPAGYHRYRFENTILASGIYYYELAAGEFKAVRKMILLR